MNKTHNQVHILAFGAHADDVEVGAGGTILHYTNQNKQVGIVDLTKSERSSNGTPAARAIEATKAAGILGVSFRTTLDFPDGDVTVSKKAIATILELIRKHTPEIILAPYWVDRHPDHVATSLIVKNAALKAGMSAIQTDHAPHKARAVLYYMLHNEFAPDITIDISKYIETKMQAVKSYSSQFEFTKTQHKTAINCGRFTTYISARSEVLGYNIGTNFGEGFAVSEQRVGMTDFEHFYSKPL